jgi:hypothetical protein
MEKFAMTRSITYTPFPYVLVCSTFGALGSLASMLLVATLTYATAVGATSSSLEIETFLRVLLSPAAKADAV